MKDHSVTKPANANFSFIVFQDDRAERYKKSGRVTPTDNLNPTPDNRTAPLK